MSEFGGKRKSICSVQVLRILTYLGQQPCLIEPSCLANMLDERL
jgi:hypothetical protein